MLLIWTIGSAAPDGDVPGTDQVSVTPMPAAKEICPPMLLIWTIAPERRGARLRCRATVSRWPHVAERCC